MNEPAEEDGIDKGTVYACGRQLIRRAYRTSRVEKGHEEKKLCRMNAGPRKFNLGNPVNK
jgi:hypothetical protein